MTREEAISEALVFHRANLERLEQRLVGNRKRTPIRLRDGREAPPSPSIQEVDSFLREEIRRNRDAIEELQRCEISGWTLLLIWRDNPDLSDQLEKYRTDQGHDPHDLDP